MKPFRNRGFVLLAVLIVTLLASMVALSLLYRLRSEGSAEGASDGAQQAWAAALSGIYQVMRIAGSASASDLQDAPGAFQQQLVTDDGADRWYFSVFTPVRYGSSEVRFGLSEEAAKLNINFAANIVSSNALEKFPQLSPSLAQALLDFVDDNEEIRPEGAEQNEYVALGRPYQVRNGALETIGELLLVRGFGPRLLYGDDSALLARVGLLTNAPTSFSSGSESEFSGLANLLTVSSYDPNLTADGRPRLNLNDTNVDLGDLNLPEKAVAFIKALHANKKTIAHPADLLEAKMTLKDEQGKDAEMESGIGKSELAILLDRTTATNSNHLPALINVNTAPAPVLAAIPGIDSTLADSIVSGRHGIDPETRKTPGWLYTQGIVDADLFKKIAPYLTGRSWQYSFEVVGYGLPSRRYRVLEAIVDIAARPHAILYLRELTRLGLPFQIDADLVKEDNSG